VPRTGASVAEFALSADSSSVVFRADGDASGVFALYRAPIAGGAPVELNPPLVSGGDVTSFALSPDSTRVVYLADQATDEMTELYSVPTAGGVAVELSSIAIPLGDVLDFTISPDSAWVVYRADESANEVKDLYAVPIAGGTPVRLSPTPVTNGDVSPNFVIDAQARYVVYHADVLQNQRVDLFRVPIGGGASIQLNEPLPADHGTSGARIDASGRWVLYSANPGTAQELFAVPLEDGGAPISIAAPLPAGVSEINNSAWVPGRSAVVYRVEQEEAGVFELFVNELPGLRAGFVRRR
jgi:Tol biopolymer transport system component